MPSYVRGRAPSPGPARSGPARPGPAGQPTRPSSFSTSFQKYRELKNVFVFEEMIILFCILLCFGLLYYISMFL